MIMNRAWAMPSGDTFSIKPISELLDRWLAGKSIIVDPFARMSRRGTITNDLNPKMPTQYHMHCDDFLAKLVADGAVADAILFDPPYSLRQVKEIYNGIGKDFSQHDSQDAVRWVAARESAAKLLRADGVCISFGWNSQGLGKKNGMEIVEILLVAHGGGHNDTIITVEKKLGESLA